MELILSKQALQRTFITDWKQKWVAAVLKYSQGLKRKDIKELLCNRGQCKFTVILLVHACKLHVYVYFATLKLLVTAV